ncbi:MAG TPA: type II toxin-antitoxin system RelE/ParE family toxin [Phycisphaerae bacterium]|nr:type II toxin-antitoxin system RelE/ParE family toxin [Phycisphaerae bacterium]
MAQKKIISVVWSDPALADLDAIADYIALDHAEAAAKLVRQVFAETDRLARFPSCGRKVPELRGLPYRELIVRPCRVVYRIEAEIAYIVLVIRSEQLLEEHRLWRY